MRIHIDPEAKSLLEQEKHSVITVSADRECVGANCSDIYMYPQISFKLPDVSDDSRYDRFTVDGVTVFFEKTLERAPEVTFMKEHHIYGDRIRLEGLRTPPPVTHMKL